MSFYVWVGIFNVFVIAQFWAFANDLFGEAQGKRLFPTGGRGRFVGGGPGAWAATSCSNWFGTYGLLLTAAVGIGVCLVLTAMADRWTIRLGTSQEASKAEAPLGKEGGFQLIFRDRYLLLVAILTVS